MHVDPETGFAVQDHAGESVPAAMYNALAVQNERLRLRLLSAAGDDLCRLTQDEIKAYSSGTVKIPPRSEFIPSCERFHAQIAGEAGVLSNCLTLAQLCAQITAIEQLCRRYNSPATEPGTHALAAKVIRIIEGKDV